MKVNDLIIEIGNTTLDEINKYNYILPGVNGPYNCMDTPVRNTAHFIGIYKYLYKLTKDKKYYDAIKKLSNYLISQKSKSGAIKCMENDKMDFLNGSIGQAWAIEGLINGFLVTNEIKYYDKAVEIFLSQKYDFDKHLWTRIELDGTDIGFDKVFNHQLWLAASGFLINKAKKNNQIFKQIDDFMKNVDDLFNIYNDGLLKHYVTGMEVKNRSLKSYIKKMLFFLSIFDPKFSKKNFEKGYHIFDLYGFAIIYNCDNNYSIFSSDKFKKVVDYALNIEKQNKDCKIEKFDKNQKLFKTNKYFYLYNTPAFEFPYIDYTFNNSKRKDIYQKLFDIQLKTTFNRETKKFDKNNPDGNTLTARLYELTKYLEMSELDNENKSS